MQPPQNHPLIENAPLPAIVPAAARLLAYFGAGTKLAILPNGMALAVQADHLAETVRLADIRGVPRAATSPA
jgi:hypothetical protein